MDRFWRRRVSVRPVGSHARITSGRTTPSGELVGLFKNSDFGDLDTSCHGLTPLPVVERSGLIWVILSPQSNFDMEPFIGECGARAGSGVKQELMFGRNEGGAQHVHRWIDKVLATSDDDLADLFR